MRRPPRREEMERRPRSLWRYREWLPFEGEPLFSLDCGFTPLLEAPQLAHRLGVARALIKNDAVSHPTLSFKDRLVAVALNAAAGFGIAVVGCTSTGNLANAVAAQAARAGFPAWLLVPHDLDLGRIQGSAVFGPRLVRVRGAYDQVSRLCAQMAERLGWGIVNGNLRAYANEGAKTMAFEIAEQLGWRLPTAVVAPMAGGSLLTQLGKGFLEFAGAGLALGPQPRLYGAQAAACPPFHLFDESGGEVVEPAVPASVARYLGIGNAFDGRRAARMVRESGGRIASVSDPEIAQGIRLLAETTGVLADAGGGAAIATATRLARMGQLHVGDELVLCVTANGQKTLQGGAGLPAPPVSAPRLQELIDLVERAGG
jgi:threonine synthase